MVEREHMLDGETSRDMGPPKGTRWRRRSRGTVHELLGVVAASGGPDVCVLRNEEDGSIMRAILRGNVGWQYPGFQQRFEQVEEAG